MLPGSADLSQGSTEWAVGTREKAAVQTAPFPGQGVLQYGVPVGESRRIFSISDTDKPCHASKPAMPLCRPGSLAGLQAWSGRIAAKVYAAVSPRSHPPGQNSRSPMRMFMFILILLACELACPCPCTRTRPRALIEPASTTHTQTSSLQKHFARPPRHCPRISSTISRLTLADAAHFDLDGHLPLLPQRRVGFCSPSAPSWPHLTCLDQTFEARHQAA